jgi:hypothetical protein
MDYVFLLRGGNAADWAAVNPILRAREPGVEVDTGRMKIGNGIDHWLDRPYVGGGSGGGSGVEYTQADPQASWNFVHGLGRRPDVSVYVAGEQVEADVTADSSSVTITFPSPTSGTAVVT